MQQAAEFISADRIAARVHELALQIRADHGEADLLVVGILKGCTFFLADLSRALGEPQELDFVRVRSYHGGVQSSGVVQVVKDSEISFEGRHVLLVEDIVDTGRTLEHLLHLFQARRPRSLDIACFLDKPSAREVQVPVRYVGFEVGSEFVVGYGLDFAEHYRSLPYVATLSESSSHSSPLKGGSPRL